MIINTKIDKIILDNKAYSTFYFRQAFYKGTRDEYSVCIQNYGLDIALTKYMFATCFSWFI